jgi:prephenate dehydrogenase
MCIKQIAPAVHQGQPIMDICSIKEFPVDIMHKYLKDALVLGTHPVFGPGSNGIAHKAFVLTPTNKEEEAYAKSYQKWLEGEQARVFILTPQKHDELMSIILGFAHFVGLAACETMLEQPAYAESKKLAGTTYRMLFTLAEAVAQETPDLYANVQTKLAGLEKIESAFIANAQAWLDMMKNKDQDGIIQRMDNLRKKLSNIDNEYEKSYELMYKMLQSTEE